MATVSTLTRVTLEQVHRDYVAALLARDSHRARSVVDRALAMGAQPDEVAVEVLAPAMREIGDRWAAGELTVAHEHYASGVTQGVLAVVAARMRRPPSGGRLAIVACPAGEQHGLAARMLGDVVESSGWEALVVGPDTPARDLLDLVADEQPDAVCLSVTMHHCLDATLELVAALGTAQPRPFVAIGGQAFNGATAAVLEAGADVALGDPRDLVSLLRERLPALPEE